MPYEVDGYFTELERGTIGRQRWLVREIQREFRRVRSERDGARAALRMGGADRSCPPGALDLFMEMRAAQKDFYKHSRKAGGDLYHALLGRAKDLERQVDSLIERMTTALPLFDQPGDQT